MDHPISTPPFLLADGYGDGLPQRHHHHHHQQQPPCPPPPASSLSTLHRARPPGDAHWALARPVPTDVSAALLHPGSCLLPAGLCATSGLDANADTSVSCLQGVPALPPARKRGDLRTQEMEGREDPGLRMEDTQQRAEAESTLHRRKHTRPTFSGYQIFVLEKAFEQNKYLSSMEKQRLAQSLGMMESQVKVWFQNRRTKWRRTSRSEPEGRTRVSPAQVRLQLDGDYDRPLDPNEDDDRVQRLLRRDGRFPNRPGQTSVLQMTKTMCTHFSQGKDV